MNTSLSHNLLGIARRVPGRRVLLKMATGMLARAAAMRAPGPYAERLLGQLWLSTAHPATMPLREVLRITQTLDEADARYWLGGGWGLDSLLGFQSRSHHDLDLVLNDYSHALPTISHALERLGYASISTDRSAAWLPRRTTFSDTEGHVIEVLGVDWDMVDAAWALLDPGRSAASNSEARERLFSAGTLAGRSVPSLTRDAQALFHMGYRQKPRDRTNIQRLRALSPNNMSAPDGSGTATGKSALLIPVFSLEGAPLRIWREQAGPDQGLPPHITVLFPFLPLAAIDTQAVDRLRSICASEARFAFALTETGWFGERVLYLDPNPSEPFARLTRAIAAAFPECQPYDGAFDTTVPHLTVGETAPATTLRHAEARIRRFLPVTAEATHVWLMCWNDAEGVWILENFFPLGTDDDPQVGVQTP